MKKKIDPSKAVPQAPRALRAGPKARAGEGPAPTPDKQKADAEDGDPDDDDDDEDEDDDKEDGDAMASHEALRADAEAKHMAAADAYKASAGTDSAAALMAAENAGDAAYEAHAKCKASSMKLRGAGDGDGPVSGPPASHPAPMAPPTAQALSALGGAAVGSQLAIAQWAGAAQELASALGAKTPAQLLALSPEIAAAFKDAPKLRAEMDKRDVRDVLAAAVHAGMPREKAFAVDAKGKVGDPLPRWLKMGAAEAGETVKLMGYEPGAPVTRSTMIIAAPPNLDDEAGLAQRAKASGMTVDARREAEANQLRSAALERGRYPQEQIR